MKDGKPQPVIAAKWMANSLMVMLEQYAPSLKKMKAIADERRHSRTHCSKPIATWIKL